MKKDKKLRYIAYVRKSSESKEKQELSHLSQIENIKKAYAGLNIVKWMPAESQSAFKPGRPIFMEMLEMIKRGEADGIIAWHPNRLSRNEMDSAEITYMLRGALKDLKFCSYNFDNSPEGIMMLQIVMNQGQYESSKQGKDVRRGMETKAGTGEKPGRVPPGYMKVPKLDANGQVIIRPKDNKVVTVTGKDPGRYEDVKRMWQLLIKDGKTPSEIWKLAVEDWKFITPKTSGTGGKTGKGTGGKLIVKTEVYRIFRNPFYAGFFEHNGTLYPIKSPSYEPMVTWEQYQTAQQIMGERGNHRVGKFEYSFSSMIRCGECGCMVQSRHRTKFIQKDGEHKTYVYYYCSRKSMDRPCNQSKYTLVEDIERDIDQEVEKYTIIPEFKDLALKILRKNNKLEATERERLYDKHFRQRTDLQAQRDQLIDYLHRELIDEEEFKYQRQRLQTEIDKTDQVLRNTERRAEDWMELNERAFNFAVYARVRFNEGNVRTKRDVLKTLGKNLILKDNKLHIEPNEWLVPIGEKYPDILRRYLQVRTNKKATAKELEVALEPIYANWRAVWDSNPGHEA